MKSHLNELKFYGILLINLLGFASLNRNLVPNVCQLAEMCILFFHYIWKLSVNFLKHFKKYAETLISFKFTE